MFPIDKWFRILNEEALNEENPNYRARVKPERLKSDMGDYGVGSIAGSEKAQEGSPFKKAKVSFKGKGFNDISPPAMEEEVEPESFEMNPTLQPDVFQENAMLPEVRERLVEIAKDFIDGLEVAVTIQDIRLTGSLANYNWSKYSDVDLHIIVDFSKIDEDTQLVKAFFDASRARWNDTHDILLHGFEVEIYIENIEEGHQSSGIYSVLHNKWIIEPAPQDVDIDFATARKKSDDIETRTNLIDHMISAGKYESSLRSIKKVKEKIRRMRRAGLSSAQKEFSAENIAFKILRRNGTLARLSQMNHDTYDKTMSMLDEKEEE
ncbi:hypothetical protein N9915_00335 [Akkermansiaceae bacterium]|nr:hypothetical protein [Akkermansiaceae bacterium]